MAIWEFLFCIVEGILDRGTMTETFSGLLRGFHEVFARFSRGFRFQNIFVKGSGEQKKKLINFCVPRGPPPRGAAEPGPPRHAKIGKNGTQKSLHAAVIKPGTISRILESLASLKPPCVCPTQSKSTGKPESKTGA